MNCIVSLQTFPSTANEYYINIMNETVPLLVPNQMVKLPVAKPPTDRSSIPSFVDDSGVRDESLNFIGGTTSRKIRWI